MLSATVERVTGAASIWATFQSKFAPETVYDAANFKPAAGQVLSRTPDRIRGAKRERDNEAKFGSRRLLRRGGVNAGATGIGTGPGRRSDRRRRAWRHNWRRGWSRRRRW